MLANNYKYVVSAAEKAELDKRYELESLYQNLKFEETRKRLNEIKEQEYFKNGNGKQFVLWLESDLLAIQVINHFLGYFSTRDAASTKSIIKLMYS